MSPIALGKTGIHHLFNQKITTLIDFFLGKHWSTKESQLSSRVVCVEWSSSRHSSVSHRLFTSWVLLSDCWVFKRIKKQLNDVSMKSEWSVESFAWLQLVSWDAVVFSFRWWQFLYSTNVFMFSFNWRFWWCLRWIHSVFFLLSSLAPCHLLFLHFFLLFPFVYVFSWRSATFTFTTSHPFSFDDGNEHAWHQAHHHDTCHFSHPTTCPYLVSAFFHKVLLRFVIQIFISFVFDELQFLSRNRRVQINYKMIIIKKALMLTKTITN